MTAEKLAVSDLKTIGLVEKKVASGYTDEEREKILLSFSSVSEFMDDNWVIDKKEVDMNFPQAVRTINFEEFPNAAKPELKDWALNQMMEGKKLKGISGRLSVLKDFFGSITVPVSKVSAVDIMKFYDDVMQDDTCANTKIGKWNILRNFFDEIGCDKQVEMMCSYILPNLSKRKISSKYIPEEVAAKIDVYFKDEFIPTAYRCIYWIMRLYPTRVEEVVSIKKDALVLVGEGVYQLSVPISKTAGNNDVPEPKVIKIDCRTKITEYLIKILKQQIAYTEKYMPDSSFLFCSRRVCYSSELERYEEFGSVRVVNQYMVQNFIREVGKRLGLKDENGDSFTLTTHKFRHTAVTDRLQSGIFTRVDTMYETGHKNLAMIDNNYAHGKKPEPLEPEFRGKVTDNTRRITMILARPYAKTLFGIGICADIRDCKSDRIACLSCPYLHVSPDAVQYMKKDYEDWKMKYKKCSAMGNTSYATVCKRWIDGYDKCFERIEVFE